MALFDVIHGAFPTRDDYQLVMIFNYLDTILLIAIISPALYILIFRSMRILDLKHEVNELLGKSGQPPRYSSAESDEGIHPIV